MTIDARYSDWMHTLEKALIEENQISSLDTSFSFPYKEAAHSLSEMLGIEEITLSPPLITTSLEDKEISVTSDLFIYDIEISPLQERVQWVLSLDDVQILVSNIITEGKKPERFSSPHLQEGFYRYALLHILRALKSLPLFENISLRLLDRASVINTENRQAAINIVIKSRSINGHLIYPATLLESIEKLQPDRTAALLYSDAVLQKMAHLDLNIGHTSLSPDELQQIKPGDLLILDGCSYDPDNNKGSVTIMLGNTPILRGRIKPDGLKILDYIVQSQTDRIEKEEDFSSMLSQDLHLDEEAFAEEHLDLDLSEKGSLESHENLPLEEIVENGENSENLSKDILEDVKPPLLLNIRAGSFSIPIKKLLEIESGSHIDQNLSQSIEATSNGTVLFKGELLRLGELIGLRVIEIS